MAAAAERPEGAGVGSGGEGCLGDPFAVQRSTCLIKQSFDGEGVFFMAQDCSPAGLLGMVVCRIRAS